MKDSLKKYIRTSPGFQYSVNVKNDIKSDTIVTNYIPLSQGISIIEDIIKSNQPLESQRSRLIIGSYGTGKSHLSTVLLSLLAKILSSDKYEELLYKIDNASPTAAQTIRKELEEAKPMLPVIINGNGKPFEQLLLGGLISALGQAGLPTSMPQTFYSAALEQINKWKSNYPSAHNKFKIFIKSKGDSYKQLIAKLKSFNKTSYDLFEEAYIEISHGAVFQPLLNGKPEDVYLEIAKLIKVNNYKGIVVLFDEFGKYLENQWENNNILDLKALQDFAEACNSSGENIIQLILITHKPISQYAVKYGQDMVNEWKKVEGRFKTYEIINQPTKVYEIISQVIIKDDSYWTTIKEKHSSILDSLRERLRNTRLFSELTLEELNRFILEGSFPLHPVSTFCLPRFSQQVAQNERTIFTFLATNDFHSLGEFLEKNTVNDFNLLTLDFLYDYFENQLKAADAQDRIHQIWLQTTKALSRLNDSDVNEIEILKALAVIKAIGLSAILPPNVDTLRLSFYGSKLTEDKFAHALQNLLNKKVLYEGPTTGNLEIIESSEINIEQEIHSLLSKRRSIVEFWSILNKEFTLKPILAKRYNDEYTMTRYFPCIYSSVQEVKSNALDIFKKNNYLDGYIFYVIPKSKEDYQELVEFIELLNDPEHARLIFVVPNNFSPTFFEDIEEQLRRVDALQALCKQIEKDGLFVAEQLEVNLWLRETKEKVRRILDKTFCFTDSRVYSGRSQIKNIRNTSDLSRLLSYVCSEVFKYAPKFNNEMINKHSLTAPITKARQKIIDGLLKSEIKPRLEIIGTGPEYSIYKSVLLRKSLIIEKDGEAYINELNQLDDLGLTNCLISLKNLLFEANEKGVSFKEVVNLLCSPPYGIRMGIIPILVAIILRELKDKVLLTDQNGSEKVLSSHSIEEAFNDLSNTYINIQNWSEDKTIFCSKLQHTFSQYTNGNQVLIGPSRQVVDAMRRWFLSLPKYTRDSKCLSKEAKAIRSIVKQSNLSSFKLLFEDLPKIFGEYPDNNHNLDELFSRINRVKDEMDVYLITTIDNLEKESIYKIPNISTSSSTSSSLLGNLKLWYSRLDPIQKERLYSDGTQQLIDIIASFNGEYSIDFAKKVFTVISGLRPEDWNDPTPKKVVAVFEDMIYEVETFKENLDETAACREITISFSNEEGQNINRTFMKNSISSTGELLQNLLNSFIIEYGDAITNNEKRQILLNLLENLVKR